MPPIDVRAQGDVPLEVVEDVAAFSERLCTLHDLVLASLAREPPAMVADVIVQDEFTHDVVLPWNGRHWLVYDTT